MDDQQEVDHYDENVLADNFEPVPLNPVILNIETNELPRFMVIGNDDDDDDNGPPNDAIENGYADMDNLSLTDTEEDDPNDNENNSATSEVKNFDLNIPPSHSYLGTDLEELRGRTLLDDGIYMNLPLLIKRFVVLFPGQTLPMAVFDSHVINMLEKCIQNNRTFGVVCLQENKLEPIGTTAEIYEFIHGGPEDGFRIKAKGRQRFQILRIMNDEQGYNKISANVKILPEIKLSHPFLDYKLASLDFHRNVDPMDNKAHYKQDKIEKLDAIVTPWPAWVYKQYDPYKLALKIRHQLMFIETRGSTIPVDPIELSFWVAQNLPLNDDERITLLKYDSAISRLQWELNYLTKDRILVCCCCELPIGKQSDIFPMSKEGPQNTFCNSGGFIHDTITLYRVTNLKLSNAPPSTEYSWFPGYAWTTATCRGCSIFMGWRFTVAEDKSLRPSSFWGLTRKTLRSKTTSKKQDIHDDDSEDDLT